MLGIVYLAAFVSLAWQVLPLIGSNGLTPADDYLHRLTAHFKFPTNGFFEFPSIFWYGISDSELSVLAWVGVALSLVVAAGYANVPILFALWALYTSFVNIGQEWYSYGWEIQLLEDRLPRMFLCPPA